MLIEQILSLSSLKEPPKFEYLFQISADLVAERQHLEIAFDPKILAKAHNSWCDRFDAVDSFSFTAKQLLAIAIALAIETCSDVPIVRGVAVLRGDRVPNNNVLDFIYETARANANAITAVTFGATIYSVLNKARGEPVFELPILEFDRSTVPGIRKLISDLKSKEQNKKVTGLFDIVDAFARGRRRRKALGPPQLVE